MKEEGIISEDTYAVRLQQGDELAFRYVMDRYFAIITSFTKRILSDKAAAEDIAEEAFIKLWQHHVNVSTFQSIKAFLYITAKNGCLNQLRQEKNLERRHQDYTTRMDQEMNFIENEIIRAEVKAEIYKAVSLLPEKMQQVFRLGFIEGLPNREIARLLGISVNTIKAQKSRAMELIKEKLQGKDIYPVAIILLSLLSK
jgi:RNA polymerase sigma-70 factor (ECF subfamily)